MKKVLLLFLLVFVLGKVYCQVPSYLPYDHTYELRGPVNHAYFFKYLSISEVPGIYQDTSLFQLFCANYSYVNNTENIWQYGVDLEDLYKCNGNLAPIFETSPSTNFFNDFPPENELHSFRRFIYPIDGVFASIFINEGVPCETDSDCPSSLSCKYCLKPGYLANTSFIYNQGEYVTGGQIYTMYEMKYWPSCRTKHCKDPNGIGYDLFDQINIINETTGTFDIYLKYPDLYLDYTLETTSIECTTDQDCFDLADPDLCYVYKCHIANGNCYIPQPKVCDDSRVETIDYCDATTGECVYLEPGQKQGCKPDFYLSNLNLWEVYNPTQTILEIFELSEIGFESIHGDSLATALGYLSFEIGPLGAAKRLLKEATAGLLNSAHSKVDYSMNCQSVISETKIALIKGTLTDQEFTDKMISKAELFSNLNKKCPLIPFKNKFNVKKNGF